MSAYPPPNEVLPIFNPANYANVGNTGTEDIPFLSTYFLRFPTSQGSETIDGTLVGKQQITAETNIVMSGTAGTNFLQFPDGTQQFTATGGGSILSSNNIFTGTNDFQNTLTAGTNIIMNGTVGTNFLQFPDGTQQSTASAGGNPTNLLSSNNNWIGNQTWNGTNSLATGATTLAPADGDNGTAVPTTAWVNTAITNALTNITPTTGNSINQIFSGAVISTVYSVPADADNFQIGILGVGGYAGAVATDIPISPGNTTDFTLYSGGQGGGAIGNTSGNNLLNTELGLAGQLLTLSCSGNGTATNVQMSWTNSITGLPMVLSMPNGGNGGDATTSSAGSGGVGALATDQVLPPSVSGKFYPITIDGQNGSPGASFAFNSGTSSTSPPYAGLTPSYDPTQLAGMPQTQQFALFPGSGTGSGTQGYGQINSSLFTSADKIYTNSNGVFYGYGASPIGNGTINITWTVGDPKQLGGTNSSFIAYDDPDPLVKTKQIYTDKEGLVVSQDLTGSYKTTTLTPSNLTQDLNGTVSTALISDIIASANAGTPTLSAVLTAGNNAGSSSIDMNAQNISNGGTFTATTFVGALTGNASSATTATTATTATNIAGGAGGSIPYQSSANTTALLANGTAGQVLTSQGTTLAPIWTTAGGAGTLQQTLDLGNTATGANATIGLTNSGVGYTSNPQLTLNNSNATAGTTTGVPSVEYYKSGRNALAGDTIASQSYYANDDAGAKTGFAIMEVVSQNVSSGGNKDGSFVFKTLVNNAFNSILTLNGSSQEIEVGKAIDLNGNALRTSTGNMDINSVGNITLTTTDLRLANTTTASSGVNYTSVLSTGTSIGDITQYLKLKLNGNDIWLPYFTQDPS